MLTICDLLKPNYMIALKTKNLANHKISKVLVLNDNLKSDLAGV